MTITTEQLDVLEKMERAATPGPWTRWPKEDEAAPGPSVQGTYGAPGGEPLLHIVVPATDNLDDTAWPVIMTDGDAAFIAAAREAVPALIAEVRRLTASLAELRECYIARTEDRDKAEARVRELEESSGARQRIRLCEKLAKAETDRAVLVEAMRRLATCQCCPFNDSDIARAALAKVDGHIKMSDSSSGA